MAELNGRWTPERRRLQSKIMSRRLRERPWSEETNAKRSAAQRGRPKSNAARAAMYASKAVGPDRTPEWERLFNERLAELNEKTHWNAIESLARERGLSPDDVKFAVDFAYANVEERETVNGA